ncbi:MAG: hypothetical protein EBU08_19780 [Micrococcales bacterium]|nr:hypothetical protein [Micrococcales bacterium]
MSHSYNIDIDSSYRDRLSYPDCGNFVIPLNSQKPTVINGFNAVDPVILGFPYDTGISPTGVNTNIFNGLTVQLGASSSSQVNFYVSSILQIPNIDYYGTIISYNEISKVVETIEPYPGSLPTGPFQYTIRFEFPQQIPPNITSSYVNTLPVNAPSTTQLNIGAAIGSQLTKEFLIGKYVYLQPEVTVLPYLTKIFPQLTNTLTGANTTYQWSIISDYNPSTYIITVLKSFVIPPLAGTKYEILNFSYDNSQSLQYAGTDIFNNPRCSTVSLVNCIVPNFIPLSVKNGGYITDYPYIFIALYTEGNRSYNQPIMSMSPVSDRALFVVPISPNTDINSTKFVTLNGGITSQTVYFKHNDSFRFEMYLPDGQPIKFDPAYFNFKTGIFTYFLGLGFPIPSDPKTNVHATIRISFN